MHDQNNVFLAIALSVIILVAWQYFFATSFLHKEAGRKAPRIDMAAPHAGILEKLSEFPAAEQAQKASRQEALGRSPRVAIETPRLRGSISLRGGRIDDVSLAQYHETTDPKSPTIELLSPSGTSRPFYAEFGWVNASGATLSVPTSETIWRQIGSNSLGVGQPVLLVWQDGQGLEFRRTISVDDKYLFTVRDEVENKGQVPVAIAPYAAISRHNPPPALGNYLLHEGAIGVLGEEGLQELTYKTLDEKKRVPFTPNGRLARLYRQILGGCPCTGFGIAPRRVCSQRTWFSQDLPSGVCAGDADNTSGRHSKRDRALVRGRKGGCDCR